MYFLFNVFENFILGHNKYNVTMPYPLQLFRDHSPYVPLQTSCPFKKKKANMLSLICAVHMCTSIELATGAWAAY